MPPINAPQFNLPHDALNAGDIFWKPPPKDMIKVPLTTAPPLELNLKAKKAYPWTKIENVEALASYIKKGFYIEFNSPVIMERISLTPTQHLTEGKMQTIVKAGAWAHSTTRVKVYRLVKRKHTIHGTPVITMWAGPCIQDMKDYVEKLGNNFIEWLAPLYWFQYEEGEAVNV